MEENIINENINTLKCCKNCLAQKNINEFTNYSRKVCKVCYNQKALERVRKHREKDKKVKIVTDTKICKECEIESPLENFTQRRSICKDCFNKNRKIRYELDKNDSDLKLSLGINNMLITLKAQTIEAILFLLKERNHPNIELDKPIHHASITVDDVITQSHFSVLRDSGETVIIQTGYNCEPEELTNIPIEQLIDLLMTIENHGYEYAADGDAIELK